MKEQKLQQKKLRAELDLVSAELDKLKARAKASTAEQGIRFDEYLQALDDKRKEVSERLDSLKDHGGDALDDIKQGLKEAKQRLAIARKAAKARFH